VETEDLAKAAGAAGVRVPAGWKHEQSRHFRRIACRMSALVVTDVLRWSGALIGSTDGDRLVEFAATLAL
jgi:hypothetical protein